MNGTQNGNHSVETNDNVFKLIWIILSKSIWLILAFFWNTLKPTITLLIVGKKFKDESVFASIGLGIAISNVLIRCPIVGVNHTVVTYLSQAYGAKDYYLLGEILNRARIFYTILITPIIV